MSMFRGAKIGTLLKVGIALIIGLIISATVYTNYLTSNAQNVISKSTTRIFDVLTIQRDTGEIFSALGDLDRELKQSEIEQASKEVDGLLIRARKTIKDAREKNIFNEQELERAEKTLNETEGITNEIVKLKIQSTEADSDSYETDRGMNEQNMKLKNLFNHARFLSFDMEQIVFDVIKRSDEEYREAMNVVARSLVTTWVVIGVSLALAIFLAFFLIKSVKEISDLRNEFVNIIAHDLRNPITAINGYLDMLTKDEMKSKKQLFDNLQTIKISALKLSSQVNNLLEVGRSEAGRVKLSLEAVEPHKVIKESVLRAEALADISDVKLNYEETKGKEVHVMADRSKLSDVLDNLISNAIKYNTKNGSVKIFTEDKGELFTISVSDTGIGVPEDQRDKLFKKYSQIGKGENKKMRSSGLGLYTVKLAMDQMGGTVTFETKVNEGTTFKVSFKKVDKNFKPSPRDKA